MKREDFVAFILTYGRPDRVHTYDSLRFSGYTGRIVLVVSTDDAKLPEYQAKFPGEVEVFSKDEIAETFDEGDNFIGRRAVIVYARNACWEIARRLGVKWFVQLDDDYVKSLGFRYKRDADGVYQNAAQIKRLDRVFELTVAFLEESKALSVAFLQGGDFIGGKEGSAAIAGLKRKCMNSFFCAVSRPFQFFGRLNEDVNLYTAGGRTGMLFFSLPQFAIQQLATQQNKGGMTETYLDQGTYLKSFYSVMFAPSCVHVATMNTTHPRIHHRVRWDAAVPVILPERFRKTA